MKSNNCKCTVCGKPMYVKPSRLSRNKYGITCSKECGRKNRSRWFSGEGNHQFGLKEDLNSSFKSFKRISNYGYVLIHKKNHPFRDKNGMVFEHRLIVENNAEKFDSKYFVEIDGKKYLKKEYLVHHKNEIKTDNRIENLIILNKSEHTSLHNLEKQIIRDRYGKISKFLKKGTPIPIKIKLYNNGKLPIRKTTGAACFDCYANKSELVKKGQRVKIPLGFGLELPYLFEAQIRPRSGLSLKGIDVALGTVDEDFRAEISAVVINNSNDDYQIEIGDRICQLAIRQYEKIGFDVVDELSETERGSNGFGSSGK